MKSRKMNPKQKKITLIIVSIVAVLFIASGVVTWLMIANSQKPSAEIDTAQENTPNLGACQLITVDDIKASYKGKEWVTDIDEGVRSGGTALNGEQAESCVFAFSTSKSNNNTLTVSAYPYTSDADNDSTNDVADNTSWSEVSSSNPMAYFGRKMVDDDRTTVYMVRSVPGNTNVLLTLRQPTGAVRFEEPDALNFLVGIVVKVNYDVLEKKANELKSNDVQGDAPAAPPSDTVVEQGKVES